jgi:hypothetical protein
VKVNLKAFAKAIAILAIVTALPMLVRQHLPKESLLMFAFQDGLDLNYLLSSVPTLGAVAAGFVLLKGHLEKTSSAHLALSIGWKIFWLFTVFFIFSAGHPETFGLLSLCGKGKTFENLVVFDFRLFSILSTVIVVLTITRSILQFNEAKMKAKSAEASILQAPNEAAR